MLVLSPTLHDRDTESNYLSRISEYYIVRTLCIGMMMMIGMVLNMRRVFAGLFTTVRLLFYSVVVCFLSPLCVSGHSRHVMMSAYREGVVFVLAQTNYDVCVWLRISDSQGDCVFERNC